VGSEELASRRDFVKRLPLDIRSSQIVYSAYNISTS